MSRYRVVFSDGRRPRRIEADWYKQIGNFIHFFVRRVDGGGQTVWRIPVSAVAEVREEEVT